MRGLFLGGDDADLDLLEAGGFEPAVEVAFGEAQPAVAVEVAGFLKIMFQEIEEQDLAMRFQQFCGADEGGGGVFGVVQGLAEDDEVHGAGFDGRILDVTLAEFEVLEAVLFGLGGAEGDDLFRIVHGDDAFAAAGEEFAQQSFARRRGRPR